MDKQPTYLDKTRGRAGGDGNMRPSLFGTPPPTRLGQQHSNERAGRRWENVDGKVGGWDCMVWNRVGWSGVGWDGMERDEMEMFGTI